MPTYFQKAWSLLRPGGVFLNHAIGAARHQPACSPGRRSCSATSSRTANWSRSASRCRAAESAGFEVRDVESLREHSILTLRHWVRRLEERADEARRCTDDKTYRLLGMYMTWSIAGFRACQPTIYQALLAKPDRGVSGFPLSRADWYR